MTTICAVRVPGAGVFIGADSQAVNCGTKMPGVRKWIVREPWAVAVAGDMRAINVVARDADTILENPAGAMTVADRVRQALRDDGFVPEGCNDGGAQNLAQQMIIAHPGGVWSLGAGFDVVEVPDRMLWADGSGRGFAIGAGYALMPGADTVDDVEQVVRRALEAAAAFDNHTGGELFVQFIAERRSAAEGPRERAPWAAAL